MTITYDLFNNGEFIQTEYCPETKGIMLHKTDESDYYTKGTYITPTFQVSQARPLFVKWRQRWTTPVQWQKHPDNPIMASSDAGGWDAGNITTVCIIRSGEMLRYYYGSRLNGIGWATAPVMDMHRWVKQPGPVLTAGDENCFDDGGVLAPWVVPVDEKLWLMYYVGYKLHEKIGPIHIHQIGLAESHDEGITWRKVSDHPVISCGPKGSYDGFSTSSACVLRVNGKWMMWYTGIAQVPYLTGICLATSSDGYDWKKHEGNPVMRYDPYYKSDAFVLGKPCVLYEDGIFKMWYSAQGLTEDYHRGEYRICYAESADGIEWERYVKNPVLLPSGSGWDMSMVEYPGVLVTGKDYHMWFSGNDYGSIGYAKGEAAASAKLQIRSGNTRKPDAAWSKWSQPLTNPGGTHVDTQYTRFFQIKMTLETDEPGQTPIIQDVRITESIE